MNYHALGDHIEERLKDESPEECFRFFCLMLVGAQYGWGKENIVDVDCSGTIAFPLWCIGYDWRTTADSFYRELFFNRSAEYNAKKIQAVFYIADTDRVHGDRTVTKGTVVHVTPMVGQSIVVDATWGKEVRLRTLIAAIGEHKRYGTTPVIRSLDWDMLKGKSGKFAWGVDPVLKLLRG